MKCRALSKNHNIVWFGKTGEEPDSLWYRLNSGISGKIDLSDVTITSKGVQFGDLDDAEFSDLGNDRFSEVTVKAYRFTIDGVTYIGALYVNSKINGTFYLNGFQAGIFTLTQKDIVPNYSEDTDAVVDSLIQRLSVIKGELWYQVNFGLPLTEKNRGVTIFDMTIMDIITSHPGVAQLDSFTSSIKNHVYTFTGQIRSVYGNVATISNSYLI